MMYDDGRPPQLRYDFRPESYTDFADPWGAVLQGIRGERERLVIRTRLEAELSRPGGADRSPVFSEMEPEVGPDGLPWCLRTSDWPRGGDRLPDFLPGEVEIARIVLSGLTLAPISIRARRRANRYHYRAVDDDGHRYELPQETSVRTLTTRRMVDFIECVGDQLRSGERPFFHELWDEEYVWCCETGRSSPGPWGRVASEIYPSIAPWYAHRRERWMAIAETGRDPDEAEVLLELPEGGRILELWDSCWEECADGSRRDLPWGIAEALREEADWVVLHGCYPPAIAADWYASVCRWRGLYFVLVEGWEPEAHRHAFDNPSDAIITLATASLLRPSRWSELHIDSEFLEEVVPLLRPGGGEPEEWDFKLNDEPWHFEHLRAVPGRVKQPWEVDG